MKLTNTSIPKSVFVFGNPDLEMDSLPLRILPELQKSLPDIDFITLDPNEEWDVPEEMTIIDTVQNQNSDGHHSKTDGATDSGTTSSESRIIVYDDLDEFIGSPQISMHDFDALANLRYLKKLGKLKKVKIIGVPPDMSEEEAVQEVEKVLKNCLPNLVIAV